MRTPAIVESLKLLHGRYGGAHYKEDSDRLDAAFKAFVDRPEAEELAALNGAWAKAHRTWVTAVKKDGALRAMDDQDTA